MKQDYCKKHLFCNLSLEIIDKLSLNDFVKIVCIIISSNHYKILSNACQDGICQTLIAFKKNEKILVKIVHSEATDCKLVTSAIIDKNCYSCDKAVLFCDQLIPLNVVNQAQQNNVLLISRKDIEKYLSRFKQKLVINKLKWNTL
jgi:HJR/Mrr/RecB family endonuclease